VFPPKPVQDMKKIYLGTFFALSFIISATAQSDFTIHQSLKWATGDLHYGLDENNQKEYFQFEGCNFEHPTGGLPVFRYRFPVSDNGVCKVELINTVYAPLAVKTAESVGKLTSDIEISSSVSAERNKYFGKVVFIPIRKSGSSYEKLVSFDLRVVFTQSSTGLNKGAKGANNSVLKDGDIYKFATKESGLYQLDYNFLKTELGISNLDAIDPRTIKIYGNGGGMLPQLNNISRPDDLIENNVQYTDANNNGKFDAGDFILFYAGGADKWYFDPATKIYNRPKNVYDNYSYYFIKISADNGARLTTKQSLSSSTYSTNTFNDYQRIEDDKVNLLYGKKDNSSTGTGKNWLGDYFNDNTKERNYSLTFPNISSSDPATVNVQFAGSSNSGTNLSATVDGRLFTTSIGQSAPTYVEGEFAKFGNIEQNFTPSRDAIGITINYNNSGLSYEGWLDYIQINCRRRLVMSGNEMAFRDVRSMTNPSTTFTISSANSNTVVWDISNSRNPVIQEFTLNGSDLSFNSATLSTEPKQYIAFQKNAGFKKPEARGKISNQNIHNLSNIDVVIIYHKNFEEAAKALAKQRHDKSNLNVAALDIQAIQNEFSSGGQDPAAIRDFARFMYLKSPNFGYLLLLGDGSFDYKGIYPESTNSPSQFIIPYETDTSFHPYDGFPSDDFYALLSDNEGDDNLRGDLDIAVGRIPCKTAAEANAVVNKIIRYESAPTSQADWRNRLLFLCDNDDENSRSNDFASQTDVIAEKVKSSYKNFNIDKVYMDAYPLVVSAGGTRVPSMNEAVYNDQFKGILTCTYLGHGGPKGLSQERFLLREDIGGWKNIDKLPLFISATCSFTGYDNPKEVSAGEVTILNPNGGAVALFSTVRSVDIYNNEILTKAVFDTVFSKINGQDIRIGDALMRGKNQSATGINGNRFTLIGDPSMQLAIPKYNVLTTKINGHTPVGIANDTIKGLQKVTISGYIANASGQPLTGFNGKIYPTVYDKTINTQTLGQIVSSFAYSIQKNIIFKGVASVVNGQFTFSFIVPKDIDFSFGKGKVSYYATDGTNDASGNFDDFIIGGSFTGSSADNSPPVIHLFMNDESFVSGGLTDQNPTLLAKISDESGINISGTSIGHDLSAVLDANNSSISLNNFYEATQNDYTSGTVRYPFKSLSEGKHSLKVKAFDVANNSGTAYIEFYVTKDAKSALAHVLNYPNPFTTHTSFQFEHNLTTQLLHVQVNIFSISGKLVKSLDQDISTEGYRVTGVEWDGKDDYGSNLARGVYIYKVKVTGLGAGQASLKAESNFEKLVIIK
jgi:hypothetical protein